MNSNVEFVSKIENKSNFCYRCIAVGVVLQDINDIFTILPLNMTLLFYSDTKSIS